SKARMPWSAKRVERAIATAWLATRIPAIAAIDKNSRRMRGLLPGHASESHRSRDFLDEDLHNGAFRRPRDVDHILVELGDSVALFSDVLDHEFVDLALDEGGFLDFGGLLDGLDGPTRTARVAFEHRDPTFLDKARVWPTTLLTQDVGFDVGLDSFLNLLGRDFALEDHPTALEGPRGPEFSQHVREDHIRIPTNRPHDVFKIPKDGRLPLDHDVGRGNLEPLSATQRGGQGFLCPGEQFFVTERHK